MNITFLIGNGFDLELGLKTRYIDFLAEYTKEDNDDSTKRFMMSKKNKGRH